MRAVLREHVWNVDSEVPVPAIRNVAEMVWQSVAARRMQAVLTAGFAAVAMMLAVIGVYGVVAYSVVKRRREIAVRMALGADRSHIRSLIFRHGMAPVLVGIGSGVVAAALATPLVRTLLFDVGLWNPSRSPVRPCSWPSPVCSPAFGLAGIPRGQIPLSRFTANEGSIYVSGPFVTAVYEPLTNICLLWTL
jgi:ABC-type antimicrobial peptide transport system permease subunit